ncbi:MAG: hypothetical protein GY778_04975 [bacterium]|nr:hypothetical protein [bacterium]
MEPIRSGTTTERIIRTGILTVVLLGYAGWSFYDGWVGYPNKNIEQLVENLAKPPETLPEIDPLVTLDRAKQLRDRIQNRAKRGEPPITETDVLTTLGTAAVREDNNTYYFGPGGMATVTWSGGAATKAGWRNAPKNESDLFIQIVIGSVVGILGLLMLFQLLRVLNTRVELTDAGLYTNSQGGLRFGGSPLVPVDSITGLGTEDFKKKGWVDVVYKLDDGAEGSFGLNDYVHKAFPQIIGEICTRRGFENPIEAEKQEARSEAGAAADPSPEEPPEAAPEPGDAAAESKPVDQTGS